jgi:DNA polymerase III psi subunit
MLKRSLLALLLMTTPALAQMPNRAPSAQDMLAAKAAMAEAAGQYMQLLLQQANADAQAKAAYWKAYITPKPVVKK